MCTDKVTLLVAFLCLRTVCAFDEMTSHVSVHEANPGETVVLHCASSDNGHNFMFWHFAKTGIVIGPRNAFNDHKYQYEVLTGNLTVRGVTRRETGLYSCVSDGVATRDILVNSVKLHMPADGARVPHAAATGTSLWKTCAILGSVLLCLVLIGVYLHVHHKGSEKPKYFDIVAHHDDDDEEDSTEELFTRQPSTSAARPAEPAADRDDAADNFEKVYTVINVNST